MMSGLREGSKRGWNDAIAMNVAGVDIRVDPPSSDEAEGGGGGHGGGNDSDPPIENENPEGEQNEKRMGIKDSEDGNRQSEFERAKRRAQMHHRKRRTSQPPPADQPSPSPSDEDYLPPYKRNRHLPAILPSKFLLGGNINDPLNLASLTERSELNRVTPQSSPLPLQGEVPVFIPKNPHDPLGLTTRTPENAEDLVAGVRKNSTSRKHRHRKRPGRKRTDSECSIGDGQTEGSQMDEELDKKAISSEPQIQITTDRGKEKEIEPPVVVTKVVPPKPVPVEPPAPAASTKDKAAIVATTDREPDRLETAKKSSEPKVDTDKQEVAVKKPAHEGDRDREPTVVPEIETLEPSDSRNVEGEDSYQTEEAEASSHYYHHEEYPEYPDFEQDYYGHRPYRPSSDYYANYAYSPSPFGEYLADVPPYESPFAHYQYQYTPSHAMQPFSPPPLPEVPRFQRRMQMFTSRPELSLRRAVFQRPFFRRRNKADPIVSPVVPQPGSRRRGHFYPPHNNKKQGEAENSNQRDGSKSKGNDSSDGGKKDTKYRSKDQVFQFGNYNQYYGYRTLGAESGDPRLWLLKKEYFEGKEVLDIGCNSGHVTLSIARDFEPKRIHGIDIDYSLITLARKNIKHYVVRDPDNKEVVFPKSMPLIYGPMQAPPAPDDKTDNVFPYNVSFAHENYVLQSDSQLDGVQPQYDVIVCLSVSKWIHLNFGDAGMKRFFRRVFLNLRENGILILEPQPWSSYGKKKKLTEKIHRTYQSIKFFPDQFEDYLIHEVGFSSFKSIGTPAHSSKGFQRPLLLFTKGASSPVADTKQTPSTVISETPMNIDEPDRAAPKEIPEDLSEKTCPEKSDGTIMNENVS